MPTTFSGSAPNKPITGRQKQIFLQNDRAAAYEYTFVNKQQNISIKYNKRSPIRKNL